MSDASIRAHMNKPDATTVVVETMDSVKQELNELTAAIEQSSGRVVEAIGGIRLDANIDLPPLKPQKVDNSAIVAALQQNAKVNQALIAAVSNIKVEIPKEDPVKALKIKKDTDGYSVSYIR